MGNIEIEYLWDKGRAIELEKLRRLLQDVSMLNNSSHFTENCASCIKRAAEFIEYDFEENTPNLLDYMRDQAIKVKTQASKATQ